VDDDDGVLDNAAWHALTTHHAPFAEGSGGARRYQPAISAFHAAERLDAEGWAALAALAGAHGRVALLRDEVPDPPPGWTVLRRGRGDQMVVDDLVAPPGPTPASRPLTVDDVDAMVELVALTEPGPFRGGGIHLGPFVGVVEDGRLLAMAGVRFHPPGFVEVSAVCTHPDARGRGLAAALTAEVVDGVAAGGERAFLHVAHGNDGARRVYERLGFRVRREVEFLVAEAPAGP
jgi:ribosomal protein S18 acetylase RimI-like enzyme